MAVMFGIALRYLLPGGDPWTIVNVLMNFFETSGLLGAIMVLIFIASLSAIMYSTLDSLISSVAFTVHNDILLQISERFKSVLWAKLVTIVLLIGMLNYYLFMKNVTGDQFDAILYLSWSFQISLVPAVFSTFIRPSVGPIIAASMLAGCAAATWPLLQGNPAEVYEVSPILALIASTVTFFVLTGIRGAFGKSV